MIATPRATQRRLPLLGARAGDATITIMAVDPVGLASVASAPVTVNIPC